MAALEVWDDSPVPSWSQVRRRLRDDPGVWSLLERALGEHPATSGRLTGLRPLRPARPSFSTWLTGTWHPDGTDVLVKVNATRRERFWMSAASQGAPGSVPHVFASDDALGPVDASWLVLERLPYTHDPGWGAAAFSSLLAAAARFQVFAAAVDTDLVFDEDVEMIRRFALGGQDLCPEAGTVVSHLDRDWAWVEAMAPREVLFGDLHFGNAAFRRPPPDLAALLYDPIPRRQPWPFEPAYLEVLCNGSGLVREMAAIRRVQGRAVCERDEVDRLSVLFCGWLALAFWSMLLDWHADPAQRARLAQYVSAAAHLDRLRHDAATQPCTNLMDCDHVFVQIDAVQREPECLTLTQPGSRSEQDEQGVPSWHSVGEGQDLSRGQQPDGGFAYLGKPDVVAGCLAYVAIPDSSAHDAGENNVDGFDCSRGEAFYGLQVLDPLLHHCGPDAG